MLNPKMELLIKKTYEKIVWRFFEPLILLHWSTKLRLKMTTFLMYKLWMNKYKELIWHATVYETTTLCLSQDNWTFSVVRITGGFRLSGCIENGIKLEKQTFYKKILVIINYDHRSTLNKTCCLLYHTILTN